MKTSITAAPIAKPIPRPSETTLRFNSSVASSSSSRTTALARSATSFTAAPTPCESVSRVGMSPPVDPLREDDAGGQRNADDEPRIWTATALRLGTLAELRTRRRERRFSGFLVRRRLPFRACFDQARLHLPDQVGVLRQRLGELRLHAAFAGQL